jgi:glucosamine-6-phosphate deaminase
MEIVVLPSAAIASFVCDSLDQQLRDKTDSCIGLTTGTTPLTTGTFVSQSQKLFRRYQRLLITCAGIYAELVRRAQEKSVSFSNATLVNPDEFLNLPQDHSQTYFTYSKQHLLDHLPAPPKQWLIPHSSPADAQVECQALERAIQAAGGIDWQLLGIGINGHVCFIEPAESLPAQCYVTPIAEINRKLYASDFGAEPVPTHAMTYGVKTLMSAKKMVLVAVGAKKAEVLANALRGPVTTLLPASLLQLHPNVTVVVDQAAASVLLATPFAESCNVRIRNL